MKQFFSVIITFNEGQFVSQVYCKTEIEALPAAVEELVKENHISPHIIKTIEKSIHSDDRPVLLDGLKNIWYFFFNHRNKSGHCYLVLTSDPNQ